MLGKLKEGVRKDLFVILLGLFFSILLCAYFLNASGLAWLDLLSPSISVLKAKILNFNFFAFLAFFSLSLAFACFSALKLNTKKAIPNIFAGSVPVLAIAFLIFPIVASYWLLLLIYPLALSALVFTVSIKLTEIKKFIRFRSFMAGIGTFTLLLAIGVFAFGVMEIMPSQEKYLSRMEEAIAGGVIGSDVQEKIVEANLKSQYQLLYNIHSSGQYQAMSEVDDERAKAFDQYFTATVTGIDEAVKNPKEYLEKSGASLEQQPIDTHTLLEQSVPGYSLFSRFFFIIYPFCLFTMIISIGNFIFRILGSFLGLALSSALKNI